MCLGSEEVLLIELDLATRLKRTGERIIMCIHDLGRGVF